MFDVSHMGEFWVKEYKAVSFWRVAVNDASVLEDGKRSITA